MSGPDLDKVTKELFDAARSEQPSPARKGAILDEVLREGGGPGGGARPLSRWMKWAGFGLLLLLAGLFAFSQRGEEAVLVPVTGPAVVAVPPAVVPPVAPREVTPPPEPVIETPPPPVVSEPPKPPPEEPDLLAAEVRLVDEARGKLLDSPLEALKVLERHRRRFPKGALKVEADLVRVEALLRSGRRDEAGKVSKKLISADPNGPVAARAQRLMESLP